MTSNGWIVFAIASSAACARVVSFSLKCEFNSEVILKETRSSKRVIKGFK